MGGSQSASAANAASEAPGDFRHLNLVGESDAFREVLRLVRRLSQCDATVLVHGETGTGKELVARAIHYLGERRKSPFIAVNCGAIPDSLVESELFGHASGAFTDAKQARDGVVAQAHRGTLFLDEVDSLSPRSQVALLRFLQDHEYRPVGGNAVRRVDVRVVAATNAELQTRVDAGSFRSDLFYRLNVLAVYLPPLRARDDDVRLLAEAFLRRLNIRHGTPSRAFHPDTFEYFRQYAWPGNVRELENLVQREFLLCDDRLIRIVPPGMRAERAEIAPSAGLTADTFQKAKARAIAQFERAYIGELLTRTRGNISLAARLSGKERSRLGKLAKKHGIDRGQFCREP